MTFTYTPSTPTDLTRVRYHIQDTDADAVIFTDEDITFVLAEEGNWQAAVVSLIRAMIAKIAQNPKFTADWLQMDRTAALKFYKTLLAEKQRELGVSAVRAKGKAVWRGDSDATASPDWNNGT